MNKLYDKLESLIKEDKSEDISNAISEIIKASDEKLKSDQLFELLKLLIEKRSQNTNLKREIVALSKASDEELTADKIYDLSKLLIEKDQSKYVSSIIYYIKCNQRFNKSQQYELLKSLLSSQKNKCEELFWTINYIIHTSYVSLDQDELFEFLKLLLKMEIGRADDKESSAYFFFQCIEYIVKGTYFDIREKIKWSYMGKDRSFELLKLLLTREEYQELEVRYLPSCIKSMTYCEGFDYIQLFELLELLLKREDEKNNSGFHKSIEYLVTRARVEKESEKDSLIKLFKEKNLDEKFIADLVKPIEENLKEIRGEEIERQSKENFKLVLNELKYRNYRRNFKLVLSDLGEIYKALEKTHINDEEKTHSMINSDVCKGDDRSNKCLEGMKNKAINIAGHIKNCFKGIKSVFNNNASSSNLEDFSFKNPVYEGDKKEDKEYSNQETSEARGSSPCNDMPPSYDQVMEEDKMKKNDGMRNGILEIINSEKVQREQKHSH